MLFLFHTLIGAVTYSICAGLTMWLAIANKVIPFEIGPNVSLADAFIPVSIAVFSMSIVVSLMSALTLRLLGAYINSKGATVAGILLGSMFGVIPIWILDNMASVGGALSLRDVFYIPFAIAGALCAVVILANPKKLGS
jgi:hypothetical protein